MHRLLQVGLLGVLAWSGSASGWQDDLAVQPDNADEPVEPASASTEPPGEGEDLATLPDQYPSDIKVYELGPGDFIITPNHHPIRRGHGGWKVYNLAGQRQVGLHVLTAERITSVPGEQMPPSVMHPGLLKTLFGDPGQDDSEEGLGTGGWTGKGLRILSDEHKLVDVSEPLLDFDPMAPLNQAIKSIRLDLLDPLSISFEPAMAWTYQHATEVRPGFQQSRSVLWFGVDGAVFLWDEQDNSGAVVFNIQAQQGAFTPVKPFLGTAVGSPLIVNNILVNSDFNLYMLYWHQQFFDKKLRVAIGKFEDQVFFDANAIAYNPLTQFMYQGFNQSVTNPFPGYGFGGLVEWVVSDDIHVRAGTMNSETTSKSTGFEYLSADHLFTMVEATLEMELEWGERIHHGNYRMMLWHNSIGQTETLDSPWDASGWGVTLNMDQQIWDGLITFCRVGWGENDVTPSNFSISAGFGIENFLGQQGDCLGFAGSWSKITELGRYEADLPMVPGTETIFELFWRMNVTDSVQVSPVLQYVHDSGAGIDDSWIWGVRSVWSF